MMVVGKLKGGIQLITYNIVRWDDKAEIRVPGARCIGPLEPGGNGCSPGRGWWGKLTSLLD